MEDKDRNAQKSVHLQQKIIRFGYSSSENDLPIEVKIIRVIY